MLELRLKLLYPVLLLFVLALAVNGGGNKPSGVHTTYPPQPTQSHTPPLCKKSPVQCCWQHAESNTVKGRHWLQTLGIKSLPKKPEEVGYNCTTRSDNWIREGHCGHSILCCDTVYNGTLHNGTVIKHPKVGTNHTAGLGCHDVYVSR